MGQCPYIYKYPDPTLYQLNQMKTILIINLLLCVSLVHSASLYYSIGNKSQSIYQCFKQSGHDRIILGIAQTNGTVSSVSIQNVASAKSQGLLVHGLYSSCRSRTADAEIQILLRAFPYRTLDTYWISLTDSTSLCGWNNYPASSNCAYLKDLLTKIQNQLNIQVGVISSRDSWYKMFKDYQGCPDVNNFKLWWVPTTANQEQNFNDYTQIGGWYLPYAKQLGSRTACNMSLIENYYSQWSVEQ